MATQREHARRELWRFVDSLSLYHLHVTKIWTYMSRFSSRNPPFARHVIHRNALMAHLHTASLSGSSPQHHHHCHVAAGLPEPSPVGPEQQQPQPQRMSGELSTLHLPAHWPPILTAPCYRKDITNLHQYVEDAHPLLQLNTRWCSPCSSFAHLICSPLAVSQISLNKPDGYDWLEVVIPGWPGFLNLLASCFALPITLVVAIAHFEPSWS